MRERVIRFLSSAAVWMIALALAGAGSVTIGVGVIAGLGYGLIVAGLWCFGFSVVLYRGMKHG